MLIISHRGNTNGPGSQCERDRVEDALLEGYDVEIDVRSIGRRLFVGHDEPLYELPKEWMRSLVSTRLWFHAKDESARATLTFDGHRVFVHDDEPSAIVTPDNVSWIHPRFNSVEMPLVGSAAVFLDIGGWPRVDKAWFLPYAICTDWCGEWRDLVTL
jgi:hypothetical protein